MYRYINQKDPANDFIYAQHPMYNNMDMSISKMGCGLCSATMIVQNLTGSDVSLREIADLAVKWGYHYSGNTKLCDMKVLAPVLAETYGLRLQMTNSVDELLAWLGQGGMAIAHLAGNREGHVGIMSQGGHYVTIVAANGPELTILDPSLVPGKFDIEGRKEYVRVSGDLVYCRADIVADDCLGKLPYFYMFARKNPA